MRWMLSILVVVLGVVAAVAPTPAAADPATEHLDGFIAQFDTYAAQLDPADPALKKHRKVVKKVQKLIKKRSISLATDATLVGKLAKFLAKGGDDFAPLGTAAEAALTAIAEEAGFLIDSLRFRADDLPDSKFKAKADKSIAKIDKILADVDTTDLKAYGKAIKKAIVERRKGIKAVKKAEALLDDF